MRRSIPFAASCAALLALSACQDAATPVSAPEPAPAATAAVQLDSGYVMRDGTPIRVVFEVQDGRAVFEGDIDLGPAAEIPRSVDELRRRSRPDGGGPQLGVVTTSSSHRWGSGVVPWVIESNVPNQTRITSALASIEREVFGVDFVPRTSQGSYIVFRRTTDPSICGRSPVGRQGGGQVVLINDLCGVRTAIHETLHSLGFWHEQSRCDRDSYVEILYNNIEAGRSDQFDRHCSGAASIFAYDEGSIMHYPSNAFGRIVNGVRLQTIRSRRGLDHLMGQATTMSWQDIRTAVWMYPTAPVISPINWQNTQPVLSWKSTRAGSYDVYLVVEEWWRHPYDGSGTGSWRTLVGSTSDTTFVDRTNPNTGVYSCETSRDMYEQRYETYFYEVQAMYGYGVSRTSARVGAAVARC
jgi:Astacin (Peptidase family M12A)